MFYDNNNMFRLHSENIIQ